MDPLEAVWVDPFEAVWVDPPEALWVVPPVVLWVVPPVALWVHLPVAQSKASESLERGLTLSLGASTRLLVGHRLCRVIVSYHDPGGGLQIEFDRPL
jgi:hypothetical protein